MNTADLTTDELIALKNKLEDEVGNLDSVQMAIKIRMNSAFGSTGSPYFRYYDPRITEAITQTGQLTIRTSERVVNGVMNSILKTSDVDYVVAIDTDSNYIQMGGIFNKIPNGQSLPEAKKVEILDTVAKDKFEPALDSAFNQLAARMGCVENKIFMNREGIASKSLHTAKKRYAQRLLNNEGVSYIDNPKLKIMGIEAVRSSTPQVCRDLISDCIMIMLSEGMDEAREFIQQKHEWFNTLQPEQIAFPRGVNNLEQYADSKTIYKQKAACPKHVRAALLYNHYLKHHSLDNDVESVFSGDKIKFISLKKPNPIYEDVIGFVETLPKEFGLHKYIDYDAQWKTAFLDPITRLFDAAGWDIEERNTLFNFS